MTPNNEYIKEFEDDYLTNPRRKTAYLNGDEKRELIGFLLSCLEQKDREWREEIEDMDWLEFRAKHKDTDQRTFLLTISEVLKS